MERNFMLYIRNQIKKSFFSESNYLFWGYHKYLLDSAIEYLESTCYEIKKSCFENKDNQMLFSQRSSMIFFNFYYFIKIYFTEVFGNKYFNFIIIYSE